MTTVDAAIAEVVQTRPFVLVFLPRLVDVHRFVHNAAFDGIAVGRRLHFVLPAATAAAIRAAAPGLTVANTSLVDIAPAGAAADDAGALPALVDLFDQFMPIYCLVPAAPGEPLCREVVRACDAEQIPCVVLQGGWGELSDAGRLASTAPFVGCWGPQAREFAVTAQQVPRRRVTVLGDPAPPAAGPVSHDAVRDLRASLGVADGERLLLFAGAALPDDETARLRDLDRAIARGRLGPVRLVYRPHPWRTRPVGEASVFAHTWTHVVFDEAVRDAYLLDQQERGAAARTLPPVDMARLSTLLMAADVVLAPVSALLFDALALDRPTVAMAFGEAGARAAARQCAAEVRACAAVTWCDDFGRLLKACAGRLKGERHKRHERERLALLERVRPALAGTYASRLADVCRDEVEGGARKARGRRTGVKRDTISHAYGAHLIAREYAGVADADAVVPGYWMHGWLPAYHNVHPAVVAQHKKAGQHDGYDFAAQLREERDTVAQWVARADQAEFLTAHGYRHAVAIGLPIVYLPPPDVRRVPRSLLVMPPHGHRTHGAGDPIAEEYADMVAALKPRFDHVWVGLNDDDVSRQQWIASFRARGVDVFTTTDHADPNTLVRLRRILATFEYVTTNGFGSHIAMAAYCGARVSVWGPFADFPLDRMRTTHAVKMFPELLQTAYDLCTEAALREHYPFLFVEPHRAEVRQTWGAGEMGEPCRVAADELRRLFGWGGERAAAPAWRRRA